MATPIVRYVAAAIPALFLLELFLFALHWLFVSEGIADARRSLATFFLNLFEIGFLFAIIQVLTGCTIEATAGRTLYWSLAAVFRLALPPLHQSVGCQLIGHAQLVISFTLFVVVIGGLIGTVVPREKDPTDPRGAA